MNIFWKYNKLAVELFSFRKKKFATEKVAIDKNLHYFFVAEFSITKHDNIACFPSTLQLIFF